jgi:large subunit ribosomal protein L21
MYAVVDADGKQHRVGVGDTVEVDRVHADSDQDVALRPVLIVGDDGSVSATPQQLGDATVRATVLEHFRGPKVTAYMYHNKTGFKRKTGHRSERTRLRIDAIDA